MKQVIKKTRRQTAKPKMISHHLRLPEPMDKWLSKYAVKNNYSSEMDAVRDILRGVQSGQQQQTATV